MIHRASNVTLRAAKEGLNDSRPHDRTPIRDLVPANAAAFIDTFVRLIDWTVVADRLTRATGNGQPRGEDPGGETLPSISVEELRAAMKRDQPLQVVDARPRNDVRSYVSKNPGAIQNEWTSGPPSFRPRLRCSSVPTAWRLAATPPRHYESAASTHAMSAAGWPHGTGPAAPAAAASAKSRAASRPRAGFAITTDIPRIP